MMLALCLALGLDEIPIMSGIRTKVFVAFGCVLFSSPQTENFLVDAGRAGRFEVGMPIDSVYLLVDRKQTRLVDLQLEGEFTPAMEIRLPGAPVPASLVAQIREWPCNTFAISGIMVLDPRFRTAEGVGVGATLRDLRRQYSLSLSQEEGSHAIVLKKHLTFDLKDGAFKDSSAVSGIWISPDPVAVRKRWCPGNPRARLRDLEP
jgi:hypothetical protein